MQMALLIFRKFLIQYYLLAISIVYLFQGLHPRLIAEGFDMAKTKALEILDDLKLPGAPDRDTLINVARTSLRTKLHQDLADSVTEVGLVHNI